MSQLQGFLQATERQEAAQDARLLSLLAVGTRGDSQHLNKTLDRLTDRAYPPSHR